MKRITSKLPTLLCVLLGLIGASVQAGDLRYYGSGDYTNLLNVTGTIGWVDPAAPTGPTTLPGTADNIRANWASNVIVITTVAPPVKSFQAGVDESGEFIIDGGSLTASGSSANAVGYNGGAGVVGKMTLIHGGSVSMNWYLRVGYNGTGIMTVDGGTVTLNHHLWVGPASGTGTIIITNGGVFTMTGATGGNGMLGLGTPDAVNPSTTGGKGIIKVQNGGVLNLFNISGTSQKSIAAGSVLDISGTGIVTIPGDKVTIMNGYVTAGKITAFDGTGTVQIDYNVSNAGKTTLKAVGGYVPPTDVVWNPAQNPATSGMWNEDANWTGGLRPAPVTKVTFNVPDAATCWVTNAASAKQLVMGENGPGGQLIVTNGGSLSLGSEVWTAVGYNSNALMVVENGAIVNFGYHLWVGLNPGSDGTLIMNGGTVFVNGMFGLGWQGGKGTARVKGGILNLSQWDNSLSIQGESLLDISGAGKVIINGNRLDSIQSFIATGQITNSSGAGLLVDYGVITLGKTTVYPADMYLPPARVTWTPTDTEGMWNVNANWTPAMTPGDATEVIFNVLDAIPCIVTNAATAGWAEMGNSTGPGGTLILTNGGSLTTFNSGHWFGVGYSSNATLIVENGSSASFAYHLWVGFDPNADGTVIVNGGTVSVGGMFGLGWNGGKGSFQLNGGTLNLSQWNPAESIKGSSVLNITGTGTVFITGNYVTSVSNYVSSGKITANGGPNVAYSFDSSANKTTLQVAPPQQSVTSVTASGGNAMVTYQTTAGHIYHLESSPSLSPAAWTRVPGSTTTATGTSASFTFPTASGQMFYRTVSP